MNKIKGAFALSPVIGFFVTLALLQRDDIDVNVRFIISAAVLVALVGVRYWIEAKLPGWKNWLGWQLFDFLDYMVKVTNYIPPTAPTPVTSTEGTHFGFAEFMYDESLRFSKKSGDSFVYAYQGVDVLTLSSDGFRLINGKGITPKPIKDLQKVRRGIAGIKAVIEYATDAVKKANPPKPPQAVQQHNNNNNNQRGGNNGNRNNQNNNNGWTKPNSSNP